MLAIGVRMSERGEMVDDFEDGKVLLEKEKGENERMKKTLVTMKETLQYVGIIGIALISGLFLVIKMAVTEAKEEARNIERASKR